METLECIPFLDIRSAFSYTYRVPPSRFEETESPCSGLRLRHIYRRDVPYRYRVEENAESDALMPKVTIPAAILIPGGPAASVVVGGLTVVNRHIIQLYGRGVRDFYLIGNMQDFEEDRFERVPKDALLHWVPCRR